MVGIIFHNGDNGSFIFSIKLKEHVSYIIVKKIILRLFDIESKIAHNLSIRMKFQEVDAKNNTYKTSFTSKKEVAAPVL